MRGVAETAEAEVTAVIVEAATEAVATARLPGTVVVVTAVPLGMAAVTVAGTPSIKSG